MNNRSDSTPKPQAALGVHEKAMEIFLSREEKDRKALDLPCGEGASAFSMVEKGYSPICADIELDHFRVPGLLCEKVDLNQKLPFADHSFDDWVCIEGIEHIENPHHLIREARRILRPEGRLLLSTPNVLSLKSRYYTLRFGYPVHFDLMIKKEQEIGGGLTVQHLNPISFIEIRYILEENGFFIRRVEANRFEERHPIRYGIISRFLVRRRAMKQDRPEEAALRRFLGSKTLLYGEILLVEAVKK